MAKVLGLALGVLIFTVAATASADHYYWNDCWYGCYPTYYYDTYYYDYSYYSPSYYYTAPEPRYTYRKPKYYYYSEPYARVRGYIQGGYIY